jgi:hypothetical protein
LNHSLLCFALQKYEINNSLTPMGNSSLWQTSFTHLGSGAVEAILFFCSKKTKSKLYFIESNSQYKCSKSNPYRDEKTVSYFNDVPDGDSIASAKH